MTEAAHQMASNPLPPRPRKPGTVGVAAGPEVAIMGDDGALLAPGETGEIVIRGPNVTAGYENNPKANAEAFTDGWFRTGDQGVLDADGYLSITGRLKEIINRGGEKISPREVDEVLMDHPAVAQVVVLRACRTPSSARRWRRPWCCAKARRVDERELREFVAERRADFKVPRKILFLDEIPKGATGKLQRIGLAAKLGLGADAKVDASSAPAPSAATSARKLALAGEDVTFIARATATSPAIRARGFRLIAETAASSTRSDVRAVQRMAEAGPQDVRAADRKAHQVRDLLPDLRALFGPDTMRRDDDQRRALVVLPAAWRALARAARWTASTPTARLARASSPSASSAASSIRPPSCVEPGVVKRHRGQPLLARRARRQRSRASRRCAQVDDGGRLQGAGVARHPQRDLGQAVGQPQLQPDQRADPRHAGGHLPLPAHARAGRAR